MTNRWPARPGLTLRKVWLEEMARADKYRLAWLSARARARAYRAMVEALIAERDNK